MSERSWSTSESVTEGHPDKLCDRVSDAILDAVLAQDPRGRVACEAFATQGLLVLGGEISTTAEVDYERVTRGAIAEVGYNRAEYGFDSQTCPISVRLHAQSPDISQAVVKRDLVAEPFEALGAGDQGIMYGYACDETPEKMPLSIVLAHRLARRLAQVRKEGLLPYLRPDGKCQVTVEYEGPRPTRVRAVVLSAQHDPQVALETLQRDLQKRVIEPALGSWMDEDTELHLNPSGRFVLGGPAADTGMTGRKLSVDTYGGYGSHGGGAFSGKDPTKVDRSASYMARHIAKSLVVAGWARRVEVQLAYAIGRAQPVAVDVQARGPVPSARLLEVVRRSFDLRPAAIIEHLGLQKPMYKPLSAYGHFGRPQAEAPWERPAPLERP